MCANSEQVCVCIQACEDFKIYYNLCDKSGDNRKKKCSWVIVNFSLECNEIVSWMYSLATTGK